jgi:hypothetical protein
LIQQTGEVARPAESNPFLLGLHLAVRYPIAVATSGDGAELAAVGSRLTAAGEDDERGTRARRIRWCARVDRLFGGIGTNGGIHGQLHRVGRRQAVGLESASNLEASATDPHAAGVP